jgi:hypothetical protein
LLYPENLSFIIEGEIKTFSNKQKVNDFMTTKSALQMIPKGILYPENKDVCNQKNMRKDKFH